MINDFISTEMERLNTGKLVDKYLNCFLNLSLYSYRQFNNYKMPTACIKINKWFVESFFRFTNSECPSIIINKCRGKCVFIVILNRNMAPSLKLFKTNRSKTSRLDRLLQGRISFKEYLVYLYCSL